MRERSFFLGEAKRRGYFEGWYFKCIDRSRRHAIALIPGMAISPEGDKHAFVQVIRAETGRTYYFDFPYSEFDAATDCFRTIVGGNRFGPQGLSVDIDRPGIGSISGELVFSDIRVYPTSALHPGIMGPLSFVPNLECNHVIIHLAQQLSGQLVLDGETFDFDGGSGYIEKDYGRSFPESYVWIQAGHFDAGDACLVFSHATIPFFGRKVPGFFAYFTDFGKTVKRFSSYDLSRLTAFTADKNAGQVNAQLEGHGSRLILSAQMQGGGRLRAPVEGRMDREIIESIHATVEVRIEDKKGNRIYEGRSTGSGMEICIG